MKKIESCSPNCVRVYKQKKSESLSTLAFGRYSCGGKTRTCDLQVMSLASYQLLHSAILPFSQFLRYQRLLYF